MQIIVSIASLTKPTEPEYVKFNAHNAYRTN